ncbi:tRNA (adenosine(37)-N6)-threonylcarbamoyltransferase complex ATPase subunit type 1 TsaE [Pontibacter beigongshangensis]|uniref:tRNA (adenosine(37)-N6)-threonylcarbamoyltransferase complex ATPase subunit type 1 TsaE n=1 Tax=Pontibacter beigongshangensis TaxID=2574733 RepID=UPI001F511CCF|nr:tRNA (adenosine(37)-N6)-threonylcarbamoyltransferase complex ATPase subunit type 1 TsaE [Pontibacter beigongshangensis]
MHNTAPEKARIKMSSLADLPAAASVLLEESREISVILFEGPMGAGKTTLIKELCRQLGVAENVSSPTFALVNEYETAAGNLIYHFDFYRIKEEREALEMGVLEYFDSGSLCLVEWPSLIPNLLPENYLHVSMQPAAEGEERIMIIKKV